MKAAQRASFTTLEGDTVHVSDFRSKIVMVDFWKTWCKPCTSSFLTTQKLIKEYPNDFVVLAVTPGWEDDSNDVKDFSADHDYSYQAGCSWDSIQNFYWSGRKFHKLISG